MSDLDDTLEQEEFENDTPLEDEGVENEDEQDGYSDEQIFKTPFSKLDFGKLTPDQIRRAMEVEKKRVSDGWNQFHEKKVTQLKKQLAEKDNELNEKVNTVATENFKKSLYEKCLKDSGGDENYAAVLFESRLESKRLSDELARINNTISTERQEREHMSKKQQSDYVGVVSEEIGSMMKLNDHQKDTLIRNIVVELHGENPPSDIKKWMVENAKNIFPEKMKKDDKPVRKPENGVPLERTVPGAKDDKKKPSSREDKISEALAMINDIRSNRGKSK